MRENLFRGKRHNGDWVFGNLFIPDKKEAPTEICIGTNVIRITYDVIPETVGQYTGLTDKNGKKIFEGDIVKDSSGKVGIVTFGNGTFDSGSYCYYGWHIKDKDGLIDHNELYLYDEYEWYEVVGNIHDNPELLKGGAE